MGKSTNAKVMAPIKEIKDLLTIQDTAEYLSVSTDSIRNFIARGALPAVRIPGTRRIYIRKDDIHSVTKPVTNAAEIFSKAGA